MKKYILIIVSFFLFMGVVSASSINGEYKGNPVVKLLLDGKEVTADDVPAMIYDNRTVVPIYLLKKMGATVTWDLDNYSADIKLPEAQPLPTPVPMASPTPNVSISDMSKSLKNMGIVLISHTTNGDDINNIWFYTNFTSAESENKGSVYDAIFNSGMLTDANTIFIDFSDKYILTVPTSAVRDFYSGKINNDQLRALYKMTAPTTTTPSSGNSTNQPQPTQPTATQAPNNTAQCQAIKDKYTLQISQYHETNNPFSGKYDYGIQMLNYEESSDLAAAGCS